MSAPHPRPAWTLTVDGIDITATVAERLVSLTLTDNRGFEADQLDLVLDDTDGRLDLPPRGAPVRLAIGWQDTGTVDKGAYVVDEIEHSGAPDQLTIRARSADLRGGLTTQMERSFDQVTFGDIVRTVAGENGYLPVVAPDLAAEALDHVDQTNESSANLLTRLARMFDAVACVKDGRLLCLRAGEGRTASGKPLPAFVIERQDGDQHRFTLAEREAYTAVRATWYDRDAGTKGEVVWGKEEEAIAREERRPVASPTVASLPKFKTLPGAHTSRAKARRAALKAWKALKPKDGWDGVKASYDDRVNKVSGAVTYGRAEEAKKHRSAVALAARDAQKIAPDAGADLDHGADQVKTLRHVYANKENARRAARAEYLKLGRGTASFTITLARGRPELLPDMPVQVRGFKPAIDATDWIATRITHNLTDAGYTTGVELEIRNSDLPG
ncbi:MAG: phage late control D family protein [Pseudomonadota bacterium]